MKFTDQKVKLTLPEPKRTLKKIEKCGRICYKSKAKKDSAHEFVKKLIRNGHESPLEHVSITAHLVCDRGISHELVRHRLASYTQESTRYCKYKDLTVVKPHWYGRNPYIDNLFEDLLMRIEDFYKLMLKNGYSPQEARDILPTCTKTELYMTANLREWRHILKLRTDKAAHPKMRILMLEVLRQFKGWLKEVFSDLDQKTSVLVHSSHQNESNT